MSLTSKYARIGYPDDGLPWNAKFVSDWTVGVNVSVPLWTSGRLSGNTLVAEASLAQARIRVSQARDGASLDASSTVERLQTALATWAATQGTVAQAERAYAIATLRLPRPRLRYGTAMPSATGVVLDPRRRTVRSPRVTSRFPGPGSGCCATCRSAGPT